MGCINVDCLPILLRSLLPHCNAFECNFFETMVGLDADADGRVTYAQIAKATMESHSASYFTSARTSVEALQPSVPLPSRPPLVVLDHVLTTLREQMRPSVLQVIEELFDELDTNGTEKRAAGHLTLQQTATLLRRLLPAAATRDLRVILAAVNTFHTSPEGLVYQRELLQALRLVNMHRTEIAVEAERAPWELYPRTYDGHMFLIDSKSMQVYTDPGEGDWPQLVGFLHGPALMPTEPPEDLFHALQALMDEREVGLEELFEHYDRDKNGYLDRMELQRICRRVAPKFKRGDFTFFFQLLDQKGNSRVSLKSLQETYALRRDLFFNHKSAPPERLLPMANAVMVRGFHPWRAFLTHQHLTHQHWLTRVSARRFRPTPSVTDERGLFG